MLWKSAILGVYLNLIERDEYNSAKIKMRIRFTQIRRPLQKKKRR